MTNLKRSFFWAASYIGVIFILGQADYMGRPIINFASYFYLAVIVATPLTLFFPYVSRVSVYVPMSVWAGVYMILLQILDRRRSTENIEFSVIVLEFVLLEIGVWLAYQLAMQISHAESLMDALALSAFPNRTHTIEAEEQRIKVEITRSRRYHRPLSLVIMESETEGEKSTRAMLKSIQHDLSSRFASARVGQIIDDRIRQTDLLLRDHRGRFIIVCPETDLSNATLLAKRISQSVKEKIDLDVYWGVAAFPEDALTFEDLLHMARERLIRFTPLPDESVTAYHPN